MHLTAAERGMLMSKAMSDESIASIFGKSTKWVAKARAYLAEHPEIPEPCGTGRRRANGPKRQADPETSTAAAVVNDTTYVESAGVGDRDLYTLAPLNPAAVEVHEVTIYARACRADPPPGGYPPVDTRTRADCERRGIAAQVAADTERWKADPDGPKFTVTRQPPMREPAEIPAKTMRFIRWFVAAGWNRRDIAWLFDVEPGDLWAALQSEKRAA